MGRKRAEQECADRDAVVAFRASAELIAELDALAAAEGISRAAAARRACLRDLKASAGAAR